MKFLTAFFSAVTILGFFLLVMGLAASHGHLQFRPNVKEDWLIFGTPLLGLSGLVWVIVRQLRRR